MRKVRSARRMALSAVIAIGVALFAVVVCVPTSASAAVTNTYISVHATATPMLAGAPVLLQVYTGSLDGSFPAGEAEVMVEGTGMGIGLPVSTANGGAQFTIGAFASGTITVDATFLPTSGTYASSTVKTSFTISPVSDSIRPAFLVAPSLGHTVSAVALLFLGSGAPHVPGGVVSFLVGGKSVGSCTPVVSGLAANYSCKATLPAPAVSGKYTVTAEFGRSGYYQSSSGSVSATIAAAKVAPKKAAPTKTTSTTTSTSSSAATASSPTPEPTAVPSVTPSSTSAPLAADDVTTDARTSAPSGIDPWAWLFVGALVLLIAAAIAVIILMRRKTA